MTLNTILKVIRLSGTSPKPYFLIYFIYSKIAVFSHAMAIKSFTRKIKGYTAEMAYKSKVYNASITRFEYTEKGWFPISENDAGHLAGMEHAPFTPLA